MTDDERTLLLAMARVVQRLANVTPRKDMSWQERGDVESLDAAIAAVDPDGDQ